MTEITLRLVRVIKSIPPGKVSSYGAVARNAGLPNGARQTVRVLHSLSEKFNLPWHRVIRSDGTIALEEGRGRELQIELLCREGVKVSDNGRIDMKRYMFN